MLQKLLFKSRHSFNPDINGWLHLSMIFSIALLMLRVTVTAEITYLFLIWNLFLGYIPYAITRLLTRSVNWIENKWMLIPSLLVWLLFIPNSFYIVTDLFHLEEFSGAPKWYDLLLVFSFAWNGLILGIISIRKVQIILSIISGKRFSELAIFLFMWVNAFGIYLGRYSRFNSWDVITKPFSLLGNMISILVNPFNNQMEWMMITTYALFMTLFYLTLVKLSEQSYLSDLRK